MSDTESPHVVLAAGGSGIVVSSLFGRLSISGALTDITGVISAYVFHEKPTRCFVSAILMSKHVIILRLSEQDGKLTWTQVAKHEMPKRLSSVCFSNNPLCTIVADTMGDVYRLPLVGNCNLKDEDVQEQHLVLGHFSLLTDVSVSDGLIATSDRDNRIRVSRFPGAFVVEHFLLGHSAFVTCVRWISKTKLVSGAGDGTVRVWDLQSREETVFTVQAGANAEPTTIISIELWPKDHRYLVVLVHGRAHPLILYLSPDGGLHPQSSNFHSDGALSGACFDSDGVFWTCMEGDTALVGFELLCQSDRTVRFEQCSSRTVGKVVIGNMEHAKSEGSLKSSNSACRLKWLSHLRKKPIVENWKGKKRKSADS